MYLTLDPEADSISVDYGPLTRHLSSRTVSSCYLSIPLASILREGLCIRTHTQSGYSFKQWADVAQSLCFGDVATETRRCSWSGCKQNIVDKAPYPADLAILDYSTPPASALSCVYLRYEVHWKRVLCPPHRALESSLLFVWHYSLTSVTLRGVVTRCIFSHPDRTQAKNSVQGNTSGASCEFPVAHKPSSITRGDDSLARDSFESDNLTGYR